MSIKFTLAVFGIIALLVFLFNSFSSRSLISKPLNIQRPLKITLINLGITLMVTFLFTISSGISFDKFIEAYGFLSIIGACICIVVSITLFTTGKANYITAQGFLLTAALLLLTGFFAVSHGENIEYGR